MTDHDSSYRRDLRRLRRLFDAALQCGELPAALQPENITPEDEDVERAAALRETLMSGDLDALRRESASATSACGLNRGPQELPDLPIPELDEARERVRRRLAEGGGPEPR